MENKKLKIGIIGCGGICNWAHIYAYKDNNDVEVVAFCDIVLSKAKSTAENFGVPDARCYESYEEMLKKEELYNRFYKQEIPALMCFLDTFDNFEDYFIKTHFWGESSFEIRNLLNEIKEFGKLIDNLSFYEESNIKKYCELAKEYWMIRNKIMKEKGIGT